METWWEIISMIWCWYDTYALYPCKHNHGRQTFLYFPKLTLHNVVNEENMCDCHCFPHDNTSFLSFTHLGLKHKPFTYDNFQLILLYIIVDIRTFR